VQRFLHEVLITSLAADSISNIIRHQQIPLSIYCVQGDTGRVEISTCTCSRNRSTRLSSGVGCVLSLTHWMGLPHLMRYESTLQRSSMSRWRKLTMSRLMSRSRGQVAMSFCTTRMLRRAVADKHAQKVMCLKAGSF